MKNRIIVKIIPILFIYLFINTAKSQDYKFSQFYNSPLNLNPANTGKIPGLYRLVANYRIQYLPLQRPSPFNTFSFSADAGLFRDRLRDDIWGIGVVFTNDRQTSIRTNSFMISTAYHKALGKDGNHYLGAGFQIGFTQRSVDLGNLSFESQFTGTGFDLSRSNRENFVDNRYIKPNMNIGIMWSSKFSKMLGVYAGFSMFNIIKAKDTFFKSDNERAYRMNGHAGLVIDVNSKVMISPNGMYMHQSKAQQWYAGTSVAVNLSGKKEPYKTAVSAGVWVDGNQKLKAGDNASGL
jgi:type IX secretion system PorP/SprF family membrane protein